MTDKMTIRAPAGKRIVKVHQTFDADPDDKYVVVEMEDVRPKLMTPEERTEASIPSIFIDRTANAAARALARQAVCEDRADIWEKACQLPRYIAVQHEQERVKRGDWNCIALEDLEKLLKGDRA